MIHLYQSHFTGHWNAQVDDTQHHGRIDSGDYDTVGQAVLAALNTITHWQLQRWNYQTFEDWTLIASVIGPDFANNLFEAYKPQVANLQNKNTT